MRPGDRKHRWQSTCEAEGFLFLLLAAFFGVGVDGNAGWIISGLMLVMALLSFRDARRGWKLKDGPSPVGRLHIARGDPTAIAALERARKSKRKYAFDNDQEG